MSNRTDDVSISHSAEEGPAPLGNEFADLSQRFEGLACGLQTLAAALEEDNRPVRARVAHDFAARASEAADDAAEMGRAR